MSAIVQKSEHSSGLPFFGIEMKTDLFQSCGHCWVFQICWHIECSTFTASKITADGDCSHEIKTRLLLGRKVMTNLDSILKSRDITLPTKVRLVKAMIFPMVKYECESWTMKRAEHRKIDVFELWCWRRLLRVPWTSRSFNQYILKEISPGCSLEGLMLKLKLQYFGHLVWRVDSLEKTLILGGIGSRRRGDNRGWDGWMASPTRSTWVWVNSRSWWWTGRPGVLRFMESQRVGHDWEIELNWTDDFSGLFLMQLLRGGYLLGMLRATLITGSRGRGITFIA